MVIGIFFSSVSTTNTSDVTANLSPLETRTMNMSMIFFRQVCNSFAQGQSYKTSWWTASVRWTFPLCQPKHVCILRLLWLFSSFLSWEYLWREMMNLSALLFDYTKLVLTLSHCVLNQSIHFSKLCLMRRSTVRSQFKHAFPQIPLFLTTWDNNFNHHFKFHHRQNLQLHRSQYYPAYDIIPVFDHSM